MLFDYFDDGAKSEDYIRNDIEKYNERWPVRLNSIKGEAHISAKAPHRYAASYNVTYYNESKARGGMDQRSAPN